MPAVRWLHWDEAYRRRERLTVTVTRYCNARNAPPLYQFRFCGPRAKSTGKKIEANSKGDDRTRPRKQMKRDYHPVVRKYAGCSEYASARRGTLRSFYRDIFSLPATRRASFFRASKVERTCSLADTGREERERDRVKLVSTSCGSFLAQDRICMETTRLLLRLASERVSWCKLHDYIIF